MSRLVGKVAIVTGAASGIGLACAKRYAEEGAIVFGTDLAETDAWKEVEKLAPACLSNTEMVSPVTFTTARSVSPSASKSEATTSNGCSPTAKFVGPVGEALFEELGYPGPVAPGVSVEEGGLPILVRPETWRSHAHGFITEGPIAVAHLPPRRRPLNAGTGQRPYVLVVV